MENQFAVFIPVRCDQSNWVKMKRQFKSQDQWQQGEKLFFAIPSPIECERNREEFLRQLGETVSIDGKDYRPVAVEWKLPMSSLKVGEVIGLGVEPL